MAEEFLELQMNGADYLVVGLNLAEEHISYERLEKHKVFTGEYENWRVRVAENLKTGTSYWCYLGKINGSSG